MRNDRYINPTVTNGDWGVSTQHRGGDDFMTLHVYKHHNAPHRMPRFISQHGEGYGLTFPYTDEGKAACDAYCILHGYLKRYGRNTCEFVSSRAFRKHTGRDVFDPTSFKARSMKYHRAAALARLEEKSTRREAGVTA